MKHYKAIFLDWDDTIGDWTTAEHKALQEIYKTYRLDRLYDTFEDYLNAYKPYNLELWGMYGRGEVTKEKLHFERFYRPVEGLPMTGDELREFAHEMGAEFLRLTNKYFCLLPDAEQVVQQRLQRGAKNHFERKSCYYLHIWDFFCTFAP